MNRAVLLVVTVTVLGAVGYGISRLHVSDPTEGGRSVELVNDRGEAMKFSLCADQSCRHLASGSKVLKSGDVFRQSVQPYSVNPFAVEVPPGGPSKCQTLRVGATVNPRYLISQLTPCGRN